jgi:hypothetical protein
VLDRRVSLSWTQHREGCFAVRSWAASKLRRVDKAGMRTKAGQRGAPDESARTGFGEMPVRALEAGVATPLGAQHEQRDTHSHTLKFPTGMVRPLRMVSCISRDEAHIDRT